MTRREAAARIGVGLVALACFALAGGAAARRRRRAELDRARSRAATFAFAASLRPSGLWHPDERVPFGLARESLGVDDDLEFRAALQAMRAARLDDPVISDPEVAIARNEAQARLEAIVAAGESDAQRSRAAGLLGVLGLARFVYETQERAALLSATIASLQLAIALDPSNDEAKYNLELAHQRSQGLELTEASAGQNPAPGGEGSEGAGAGQPGTGYYEPWTFRSCRRAEPSSPWGCYCRSSPSS